ncbi:hypothetical protein [Lacticaseibacillus saniviri]|uniref:Uncharacterized protein n=1 Tax=Lacticaseibacillus saniviri JCM 17471 = DSM 24301 TaxID=1293598 RepID=A0A0R2MQL7_9LACO|nr:hypothetical protein [Lacticaseibacillus saniviri]KRO15910.1 hypothetical protein IV56_GL002101 [Lacticaseibacillus saniviri JCM 17471 = DSM 24301]
MSYFDDFISLLPGSINGFGTNVQKLARFVTEPMSEAKELLERVEAYRNIDKADGAALDKLGEKYGQARGPADDEFYRVMIKSKIIIRAGDATVDGILRAIQSSLNVTAKGIRIETIRPNPTDPQEPLAIRITNVPVDIAKTDWEQNYLFNRIKSVVAAGVHVQSIQFMDNAGFVANTVIAANTAMIFNREEPFE